MQYLHCLMDLIFLNSIGIEKKDNFTHTMNEPSNGKEDKSK